MLDLVLGLLGPWGSLAVGAVLLAGLGYVVLRIRNSGRDAERAKRARIDAQAVKTREDVEDAIAGRTPDENRRRLGKWARP